jgi:rhomboid family GlyGly-CTERM serine protease
MTGALPTIMTARLPNSFTFSLHASYFVWLLLFVFSFLIQVTDTVPLWRFDRERVAEGQYWLLVTGHIAHMNWSHWLLNMAGLAIVAFFFSRHGSVREWLAVILVSMIAINLGVWFWVTDLKTYVGLSGVLHGLFIYGALREIRFYPLSGYVLLIILVAKLAYEAFNGALPGSEDMAGGRVLTQAHLLGAVGGGLTWGCGSLLQRLTAGKPDA